MKNTPINLFDLSAEQRKKEQQALEQNALAPHSPVASSQARSQGRKKKVHLTLSVLPETRDKLFQVAEARHVSVSTLIQLWVDDRSSERLAPDDRDRPLQRLDEKD